MLLMTNNIIAALTFYPKVVKKQFKKTILPRLFGFFVAVEWDWAALLFNALSGKLGSGRLSEKGPVARARRKR